MKILWGHEKTSMCMDACRQALEMKMDALNKLPDSFKLEIEYKLLVDLYDSITEKKGNSSIDLLSGAVNLLDKIIKDFNKPLNILNTFCFKGDNDKCNIFLSQLSHAETNTEVRDLILSEIRIGLVEENFDSLPKFVNVIMFFVGENTKINAEALRKSLSKDIHVRPRYGTLE